VKVKLENLITYKYVRFQLQILKNIDITPRYNDLVQRARAVRLEWPR